MPRSNRTKLLLAQSLRELLAAAPLDKISVNDIVEKAGVGRNTFYYHFEDKYDLVNWYFQSGATKFLLERSSFSDWESMLRALEEYFRENKTFYTRALEYNGQNSLQQYIFEFTCSIFMQRAREIEPQLSRGDAVLVGRFLGGAFMGILMPWVRGGMRSTLSMQYDWLHCITSGKFSQLLLRSSPFGSAAPGDAPAGGAQE